MKTDANDLSRRDRNKLRNQREILDAALAVFAEKGYGDASIQEIADRADFAVSTIYGLFENKEDVYRKATVDVAKRCGAIYDEAMAKGEDEYAKLVNFARAKGAVFQESPDGARMLANEQSRNDDNDQIPQGISEIYDRFLTRIRDLFEAGIARGIFIEADPNLLAHAFDSATTALVQLSLNHPETYRYDERVGEVITIFFDPVLKKKGK